MNIDFTIVGVLFDFLLIWNLDLEPRLKFPRFIPYTIKKTVQGHAIRVSATTIRHSTYKQTWDTITSRGLKVVEMQSSPALLHVNNVDEMFCSTLRSSFECHVVGLIWDQATLPFIWFIWWNFKEVLHSGGWINDSILSLIRICVLQGDDKRGVQRNWERQ